MKLGFSEPKLLVMDSITEPVTSGSELEEGEIDDGENNDIEIISERIVKVPMVAYKRAGVAAVSPIRKRSDWEDVLVDLKSKRMKSSCEITPELPHKFQESVLPERSHRQQRLGSHSEQPSDTHKNYQSRNQHKNSNTSRRHADLKKKLKSSPKSQNQNNRFKTSPPNSPRVSVAERDPNDKKAPTKSGLSEANIKIKENDKNDDTDDEEMELRLAALKSVVTKTTQTEKASDKPTSLPLVLEEPKKVDSEEDEDEELLRAQLLIEVAKKQTNEMELQVRMDTVTSGSNATVAKDSSRQSVTTTATTASAAAAAAPMLKRKFNQHVQIPKTDRLVIDLRDDSSDSSDEDEVVEDAISAFIRSARQSVDQKTNPASNAVSALPLHEQEEYLRLKGEIERRENKALAASASSAAAAATAQKLRAKSPTDATTGSPNAPVVQKSPEELPAPVSMNSATTIVEKTVEVLGTVAEPSKATQQTDVQSDSVMQPECNDPREAEVAQVVSPEQTTGEESKAAKEPVAAESQVEKSSEVVISKSALTTNVALQANVDSSPKPSVPVKSGSSISEKLKASAEILHAKKVAALKQQLLQKKNAAKDALKSQLELVDKNRALLERSSQEVVRLKAMLQSAEETERQFKLQLNNSQSQLQQLSKKMLFLEKELSALHNGATLPRAKRLNQKLRAKALHTAMSVMNSSSHASQLRVKPTILTKALVKKPVATANREKAVNLSEATSGRLADLPDAKMSAHKEDKSAVNKAGTYENWLYGILGDASDSTPVDNYPSWSSNEHASRKVAKYHVNSRKVICNDDLSAKGCQDKSCPFQHLPQDDSALLVQIIEPTDPNVLHSTLAHDPSSA